MDVNPHIFRSYDIRGIYGKDLDEQLFEKIGNAFAQHAQGDIAVACDARISSESLSQSFITGAMQAGKNIIDIGEIPLPAAVDWAALQNRDLAYITASHLGKEWNGIKFFNPISGIGYSEDKNYMIRDMVVSGEFVKTTKGVLLKKDPREVLEFYIGHITKKMPRAAGSLKILADCGDGAAGHVVKDLFAASGFDIDVIFEKPDGTFPNRHSDPGEDPLTELTRRVKDYDFGIAYDGDADRFAVVTRDGKKLSSSQIAYVILSNLLKKSKGKIVANIECSMLFDDIAKKFDVELIRCRVGHTFLMEAVKKSGAVFGMEFSGHYVLPFLSDFDDAIGASLYFAHSVESSGRTLEDILEGTDNYTFGRMVFECADDKKFSIIEKVRSHMSKTHKIDVMDGLRIDFEDSWALIRASNTSPAIRVSVEARSEERYKELQSYMSNLFLKITGL